MLALIRFGCAMASSIGFASIRLTTPPKYEEVVSALPESTRSRFPSDPKELSSRIDNKISSIASSQ
jgi:hypothetical protein